MKKIIVCTLCPNGCEIEAEYSDRRDITISGNRCSKGYGYAEDECFDPKRIFTGSVEITGSDRRRIPVRSSAPIPKDMMLECAGMLRNVCLDAPVEAGYVILEDIFGTGADIIATICMGRE